MSSNIGTRPVAFSDMAFMRRVPTGTRKVLQVNNPMLGEGSTGPNLGGPLIALFFLGLAIWAIRDDAR